MSLTASLLSAVSSLNAVQAQFQITSSNIANVNTPGYSRKTVALSNQVIDGRSAGVRLGDVTRTVNDALVRELREHISQLGGYRVKEEYLTRTQGYFGTLDSNSSISHRLSEMGSAFDALAVTPDSPATRSAAVLEAQRTAGQLNLLTDNLQQMRSEADREIGRTVERINQRLGDISELNHKIERATVGGDTAPDLQDQRDQLIKELAEDIDIQYFERTTGEVVIMTSGGRTLLDNQPVPLSHTPAAQISAATGHQSGLSGVLYGATSIDITDELSEGRLGALLEIRDDTLVDLQAQTDRLAEVLRDQVNALHNDGTAYPPPASLTGLRSLAATDAPTMSGNFRVSVLDSAGVVVETLDIDLATLAPPNVGQLVTQIDGMANATASLDASGQLVIAGTGGNRIAVNELDSLVTTGSSSTGLGHFLGLNNLLDEGLDYDRYASDRLASDTAALSLAGSLSFDIAGTTTNVAYAAGDSLSDIAAAINGALGGANITASVVREAEGYRLQIIDNDGDNFFLSDSGPLTLQSNLRPGLPGTAGRLELRQDIQANPDLLARGELSDAAGLAAGDIGVSAGNGDVAAALGKLFTSDVSFAAAGGLSAVQLTLEGYGASIVAGSAALTNAAQSDLDLGEGFQLALENQAASLSQVNLDEELANIVVLQNTYAASARITTAVSEMLDTLLAAVR
ncbi:MAG: flagellar hook-associated protein FlgK [Kiloniellales bacterium]|nr:flagellar hook-associated protein FlgK [Kiloniellales bacterium]